MVSSVKQNNIPEGYPAQSLLNKLLESAMIELNKQARVELPAKRKGTREVDDDC